MSFLQVYLDSVYDLFCEAGSPESTRSLRVREGRGGFYAHGTFVHASARAHVCFVCVCLARVCLVVVRVLSVCVHSACVFRVCVCLLCGLCVWFACA